MSVKKVGLASALRKDVESKGINLNDGDDRDIVDLFFDSMADALVQRERIEIRGLWNFFIKDYDSYTGRNPKTQERVSVGPKALPFFKPGKELKERVDGGIIEKTPDSG